MPRVKIFQRAGVNWDTFTGSTDPAVQAAIRNSVSRLATYTPYFDNKLAWFPNAFVYLDSYAIYVNSPVAAAHPEWILKDRMGTSSTSRTAALMAPVRSTRGI